MSFNPTLASALDRVRFAVGDTNTTAELLPDDTYNALLAGTSGDETRATVQAADYLVVRYAQEPDKLDLDGGKTAAEWNERIGAWRRLADRLRGELAAAAAQLQQGARTYSVSRFTPVSSEYSRRGRCDD
jgi:hypothetical protein